MNPVVHLALSREDKTFCGLGELDLYRREKKLQVLLDYPADTDLLLDPSFCLDCRRNDVEQRIAEHRLRPRRESEEDKIHLGGGILCCGRAVTPSRAFVSPNFAGASWRSNDAYCLDCREAFEFERLMCRLDAASLSEEDHIRLARTALWSLPGETVFSSEPFSVLAFARQRITIQPFIECKGSYRIHFSSGDPNFDVDRLLVDDVKVGNQSLFSNCSGGAPVSAFRQAARLGVEPNHPRALTALDGPPLHASHAFSIDVQNRSGHVMVFSVVVFAHRAGSQKRSDPTRLAQLEHEVAVLQDSLSCMKVERDGALERGRMVLRELQEERAKNVLPSPTCSSEPARHAHELRKTVDYNETVRHLNRPRWDEDLDPDDV